MLQVSIGALLLVAGIIALFPFPVLGVPMIAVGYLMVERAPNGAGSKVQGMFFGFALLCMAITLVGGLLSILF